MAYGWNSRWNAQGSQVCSYILGIEVVVVYDDEGKEVSPTRFEQAIVQSRF